MATSDGCEPTSLEERRLLRAARDGDAEAIAAILRRYEDLVASVVSGFYAPGLHRDDFLQEGRLAVLEAIDDWDPRLAPFRQFVRLCVRRDVMSAVIAARRRKHAPVNFAVSFEERRPPSARGHGEGLPLAELLTAARGDDPLEQLLVREQLVEILQRLPTLSPIERRALALIVAGISYADAAELLGGGRKSVDNALQRARRKLAA
jgi:RNA polymerase sporulation-specific sigma factor